MISKAELKHFEEILRKDQVRLLAEIKLLETPTNFGDEPGSDLGEKEQDEDEELENTGGAADELRSRLADVEDALAKIKTGEYGICEECGRAIETEVLEVAPESSLCREDKLSLQ